MSDKVEILFNVNADNVRLHAFIPKHGKAEDAVRSAELQFRNARIMPMAAAALLLGEEGGVEVERAFFVGDPPTQRFWGIDNIHCTAEFKARHTMQIDDLDEMRVTLVDKIKLRLEGGPQRLIWADFSVHLEDPSAEEVMYFHEMLNRDVSVRLDQTADLVDEMRAKMRGMSVSTTVPNGELDLDQQAAADAERAAQVGDTLDQQNSAAAKKPAKRAPKRKPARAKKAA